MTPEQVKQKFRTEGRTFTDFAKQHGFDRNDVYRVLNGQLKGYRGTGHEIAVKLGLKPNQRQAA